MATKLLLLEDVESLGRSGEIVHVKPGYGRNFLIPQGFAVVAEKSVLRLQEKLKAERHQRALNDKQESDEIAARLDGIALTKIVKVDHDGHMYGSVTAGEIIQLLQDEHQVLLDKKSLQLKQPIKATGVHEISVKLKEGVVGLFRLKVMSEEGHRAAMQEQPEG